MKLKIGGFQIQIVEDETILPNESRIGEYSPFEQKIKLAKGMTNQQQTETLIHEILEVINDIYELNLDHDEQLCKLSVVLHQIISDNETLISALHSYDLPKFSQQ